MFLIAVKSEFGIGKFLKSNLDVWIRRNIEVVTNLNSQIFSFTLLENE